MDVHLKRHHTVTGRKTAGDGRKPFDERQPAHERDVFAKDDQLLFVINRRATAFRIEQERRVENVAVIVGPGAGTPDKIFGIEDQPEVMGADEVGDGGVAGLVEFRHGGFRPDEQIGLVRERAFRKFKQLPETIGVRIRVPNQSLRNAGLNERDSQRRAGRILSIHSRETEGKQRPDCGQRQKCFRLPRKPGGRPVKNHAHR